MTQTCLKRDTSLWSNRKVSKPLLRVPAGAVFVLFEAGVYTGQLFTTVSCDRHAIVVDGIIHVVYFRQYFDHSLYGFSGNKRGCNGTVFSGGIGEYDGQMISSCQ